MQKEVCNKNRIGTNIVYRWIPSFFPHLPPSSPPFTFTCFTILLLLFFIFYFIALNCWQIELEHEFWEENKNDGLTVGNITLNSTQYFIGNYFAITILKRTKRVWVNILILQCSQFIPTLAFNNMHNRKKNPRFDHFRRLMPKRVSQVPKTFLYQNYF